MRIIFFANLLCSRVSWRMALKNRVGDFPYSLWVKRYRLFSKLSGKNMDWSRGYSSQGKSFPKWKISRHVFVVYIFFWILSKFDVNQSKSLWVLTLWSVPYKRKLRSEKIAQREISCFASKLRPQTPSRIAWPISVLVGLLPVTSWWNFRAISSPNKCYCFASRRNHPLVLACGVLAEMGKTKKTT